MSDTENTTTAITAATGTSALALGGAAMGDIDIPRLNVLQKMSDIEGPVGSVVLDKEAVILLAGQKAPVIIAGAIKKWKEDVPFGDEYMPKFAATEEEAAALKAESNYDIIELAEIIMLIPQIGDDDTHFPYPIGDKNYQIGRLTVQKDSYRMTYKRLFTFATFNPKTPITSLIWMFSSDLMTKGKYSWYVPSLTSTKELAPQEAVDFITNAFAG